MDSAGSIKQFHHHHPTCTEIPPAAAVAVGLSGDLAGRSGTPVRSHALRSFTRFDLADSPPDALHVLAAGGRSLQVLAPARWVTLWVPLSGALDMTGPDSRWRVSPGKALVWRDRPLRVEVRRAAGWIAVCGAPQAWEPVLHSHADGASALFPYHDACPRALRRLAVRAARMARHADAGLLAGTALWALGEELLDWQQSLRDLLARCTGRTLRRRRQTLMRLLWVRHLIEHGEDGRLDLATLAANANYSPCHLVRSYRNVFGETPFEYAARLRLQRAWRLVMESGMPVCEIAEMLGFESQSAFCRAFRNAFGMTTGQARQQHRDPGSRMAA
jgi:AraC family transcriptional regulator